MFTNYLVRNYLFLVFISLTFTFQSFSQCIDFDKIESQKVTNFQGVYDSSVAFADVDLDGDQDVLITGNKSEGIASSILYLNNGSGQYEISPNNNFENVIFSSVAFADIDGDNDPDLLITGSSGYNVYAKLYKNDGKGIFSEVKDANLFGVNKGSIAFSDIDGDNDLDLLITGRGYLGREKVAKLYSNDGSGNFAELNETPFVGVYNSSVEFSDINDDGDQDVIIMGLDSSNNAITKLYSNNGTGTFTELNNVTFENLHSGSLEFSDIDGDNDLDILLTGINNSDELFTKLYKNDGSENFSELTNTPFDNLRHSSIAFGDVDGDNDPDLLVTGDLSFTLAVQRFYKNDGAGNFTIVENTPFAFVRYGSVKFLDIDKDNDLDLIVTGQNNANQGVAELYRNDGTGVFSIIDKLQGVSKSDVSFSDTDGDGDQDMLLTGSSGNTKIAKLYRNDGVNGYNEIGTPFAPVNESAVAFADIDNDGDEDVLIAGQGYYSMLTNLYKNDGFGGFEKDTESTFIGVRYAAIAFADVDDDDDLDVLVTGQSLTLDRFTSTLYINDGKGKFSEAPSTPFKSVAFGSVSFEDFDNDGDQDVFITGRTITNGVVSNMYFNDGSGNFSLVNSGSFEAVGFSDADIADVDNDGDKDILLSGGKGYVSPLYTNLYLNNGKGKFTKKEETPFPPLKYASIQFADIDGDNDQDVFMTGRTIDQSRSPVSMLFSNDGSGIFTEVINMPMENVERGTIGFVDIDGDLDLDLFSSGINNSGNDVSSFYVNNTSKGAIEPSFSFTNQSKDAIVDSCNNTITLYVPSGTDITSLSPVINLPDGYTVSPGNSISQDFTNPIIYSISKNGISQSWTVSVITESSSDTDILTFELREQASSAIIDPINHTVTLKVIGKTELYNLIPEFTLSTGATTTVNSIEQITGVTGNDFYDIVIYTVIAEDGITKQSWRVTITRIPNNETNILSFIFYDMPHVTTIDANKHTVNIDVLRETDVTLLNPNFDLSKGAKAFIGENQQNPGMNSNDFTNNITYTIVAEDDVTFTDWIVSVTPKDVLSNPINEIINVGIFPNPVTSELNIELSSFNSNQINVRIITLTGMKVLKKTVSAQKNIKLDVNHLPSGVYFLTAQQDNGIHTFSKFIKK